MLRPILLCALAGGAAYAATSSTLFTPAPGPAAVNAPAYTAAVSAVHCQVPCGIYGDHLRIEAILEDCATIQKAMEQVAAMESGVDPSANQIVRWIMNKESHAQKIQDQVADYWLAQRVKAPKSDERGAQRKYIGQLMAMHRISVSAMKCKQTTDTGHVDAIRETVREFSAMYFSEEDLQHLQQHIGGDHDHADPSDSVGGHHHEDGDGHSHDHDGDHSHGDDADHDHGGGANRSHGGGRR